MRNLEVTANAIFVAFVPADATVRLDHAADDFRWRGFEAARQAVATTNPRVVLRRVEQDFLAYEPDPWFELDPRSGRPMRPE